MTAPSHVTHPHGPDRRARYAKAKVTKLLNMLKGGNSTVVACRATGIPRSSLNAMLARGRVDREAWIRSGSPETATKTADHILLDRYEAATVDLETHLVKAVRTSATDKEKPNVADAKWLLTRLNPKRWGEKATLHHTGEPPIERGELHRSISDMAAAVRDEIMGMDAPEREKIGALGRVEQRWKEIIRGWQDPSADPRRADLDEHHDEDHHTADVPQLPAGDPA